MVLAESARLLALFLLFVLLLSHACVAQTITGITCPGSPVPLNPVDNPNLSGTVTAGKTYSLSPGEEDAVLLTGMRRMRRAAFSGVGA